MKQTAEIGWFYRFLCWLLPVLARVVKGRPLTAEERPYEVIKIGGVPYLTRFYILGRDVAGKLRLFTPNARKVDDGESGGDGFQLFLHFFHASDQEDEFHNHPYTGTSLILAGGYREERRIQLGTNIKGVTFYSKTFGRKFLPPLTALWNRLTSSTNHYWSQPATCINGLNLANFHRTDLVDEERGCWTLFLTGARVQKWGFLNRFTEDFIEYQSSSKTVHTTEDGGRDGLGSREERDARDAARRAKLTQELEISERNAVDEEGPTLVLEDLTDLVDDDFWPGDKVNVLNYDGGPTCYYGGVVEDSVSNNQGEFFIVNFPNDKCTQDAFKGLYCTAKELVRA
jgi:hypothetical protein